MQLIGLSCGHGSKDLYYHTLAVSVCSLIELLPNRDGGSSTATRCSSLQPVAARIQGFCLLRAAMPSSFATSLSPFQLWAAPLHGPSRSNYTGAVFVACSANTHMLPARPSTRSILAIYNGQCCFASSASTRDLFYLRHAESEAEGLCAGPRPLRGDV